MIEGRPSTTALRVAMRRAAHQLIDDPKVFDDPLALQIIGDDRAAALRARPRGYELPGRSALRAFLAARSRHAEDRIAEAVAAGVRQVVVLGAGLDTFAYRHPYGPELRVFEVDHPASQAWKRRRLEATGIEVPGSLTFTPVDFERQTLADGLAAAGLDRGAPAFYSWLGVTPYLARESVFRTLAFVAGSVAGSGVTFDYGTPPSRLPWLKRWALRRMSARVASIGEPWVTFFDPAELDREVRALGFACVEDLGTEELNDRYFANRRDGLKLTGIGRLMTARV
jgi:methyltransferase (TIGR00027 family)